MKVVRTFQFDTCGDTESVKVVNQSISMGTTFAFQMPQQLTFTICKDLSNCSPSSVPSTRSNGTLVWSFENVCLKVVFNRLKFK